MPPGAGEGYKMTMKPRREDEIHSQYCPGSTVGNLHYPSEQTRDCQECLNHYIRNAHAVSTANDSEDAISSKLADLRPGTAAPGVQHLHNRDAQGQPANRIGLPFVKGATVSPVNQSWVAQADQALGLARDTIDELRQALEEANRRFKRDADRLAVAERLADAALEFSNSLINIEITDKGITDEFYEALEQWEGVKNGETPAGE